MVLMPFSAAMREVYTDVYKIVCEKRGVNCWRVDEIAKPGSITKDIVAGIVDSDLIIADLTGKNPNVFYELGIAHSAGNKTIMTCQNKDDIPFDIANYRVIFYEQTATGCKALAQKLDSSLGELLHVLQQANNPVQEVLAQRTAISPRKKRKLLIELIDPNWLGKKVRDVLAGENVVYPEQLAAINLERVRVGYRLGSTNLAQLLKLILHFEAYSNDYEIQEFMLRHKVNVGDHRLEYIVRNS